MNSQHSVFAGSIPELYDRCLGPLIFEPYAIDLANRVADLSPANVLETAAGTGIVTLEMAKILGSTAQIHATDLNQPMLDIAAGKISGPNVILQQADATALPFDDGQFDVVVCQFGVMFFPDKLLAFQQAFRVLKTGGHFIFNVWDRLELNEIPHVADQALAVILSSSAPSFFRQTPYGYNDAAKISTILSQAGFSVVHFECVARKSRAPSAGTVALGICQGTPMRGDIEARSPAGLDAVTANVEAALVDRFGPGPIVGNIQAIVFTAVK